MLWLRAAVLGLDPATLQHFSEHGNELVGKKTDISGPSTTLLAIAQ
jgi:hypothetical protein